MWTVEKRRRYDRSGLRYPSDLTDEEWSLIAPQIPPAKRGGNKRTVDVREVVNAVASVPMRLSLGGIVPGVEMLKDQPVTASVNADSVPLGLITQAFPTYVKDGAGTMRARVTRTPFTSPNASPAPMPAAAANQGLIP